MKLVLLHHLSNHLLKCAALILSILCWLHINYNQEISCSIKVPLLFEHTDEEQILHAPETVALHVQGTRNTIYSHDLTESAIRIDARKLHAGKQTLALAQHMFFLPESITMLDYTPCIISVD